MRTVTILAAAALLAAAPFARAETVAATQAQEKGFTKCLPLHKEIAEFASSDAPDHGALSTWNTANADGHLFHSLAINKYHDGHVVYSLFTVPPTGNGCDGGYTSVVYFETSCTATREQHYSKWKFEGELAGLPRYSSEQMDVVMMPAGQGCVVVKNEIVYREAPSARPAGK